MSNNSKCPKYKDKYDKMGVTPHELYLRQNGLCYIELVYDEINGDKIPGDMYCTDGKDYALTKSMLNPTIECMYCITSFLMEKEKLNMIKVNKLNKTIINLLQSVSEEEEVYSNKTTLDKMDSFFSKTTMFSKETTPLKVFTDGNIYLFGKILHIDDSIEDDYILLTPSQNKLYVELK